MKSTCQEERVWTRIANDERLDPAGFQIIQKSFGQFTKMYFAVFLRDTKRTKTNFYSIYMFMKKWGTLNKIWPQIKCFQTSFLILFLGTIFL